MFKKYNEFINEASMDNFQMYLTKLADHLGDRQLARDAKTKSYLKSMFKKDTDYQKFTDDEIKNLSGEELHNMIKYDKRFNENVNEAKVTAKTIDKLTNEISKLTKDLKDNFAKYKSAKTDEDKKKYMKIAGELTSEKKAKDSELEMAIQNFGADMELDMSFESKVNEDGHTDVAYAKRKLKTAMEDAAQILQKLESMESEGDLPSWWMGKITLASDYLNKSRDYLLYPDMNENKYDTALDKMDKWLPADPDAQERYYEILNQENWKDMLDFFMANGSMGDLARYGIKSDRDLEKLAKLAMESYGPVTAQRLNESTNRIL